MEKVSERPGKRPERKMMGAGLAVDRVLPNSADAEKAVLGAMLLDPQAANAVREQLQPESFYFAAHQAIYRELSGMLDVLQAVDMVTLTQRLHDKGLLDEIGGPVFISDLFAFTPTAANVDQYIEIVRDKHVLRKLIGASADIISRAFEEQDGLKEWLPEVQEKMFAITTDAQSTEIEPMATHVKDVMHDVEQAHANRGILTGIATGYRDLDKLSGGLRGGEMIVLAARPSMGKSALAMNIATNIALRNEAVGVFSLEMTAKSLVKRMMSGKARVNFRALEAGFMSEKDIHPLTNAASQLMKANILIDDRSGLTIAQVRNRARMMKSRHNIKLLVIDYLGLMRCPSRRAELSRQTEVSDISSGVKELAKELEIPVLCLAQLNRNPDQRENGMPRLSDLRESGTVEQDADMVWFLVRPEEYAKNEEEKQECEGQARLRIAKQRNGPTADVDLTWLKEYTLFVDRAKVEAEDLPGIDAYGEAE